MKLKAKGFYIISAALFTILCIVSPLIFKCGVMKHLFQLQMLGLLFIIPLVVGLLVDYREKNKRGFLVAAVVIGVWCAIVMVATRVFL